MYELVEINFCYYEHGNQVLTVQVQCTLSRDLDTTKFNTTDRNICMKSGKDG